MVTLGIDLGIVGFRVGGPLRGWLYGGSVMLVALVCWYIWFFARKPAPEPPPVPGKTPISTKTDHVLTEARLILPGAQALLGFQFAIVGMRLFDQLPQFAKEVHLGSLGFVALSVILLPAYTGSWSRGTIQRTFTESPVLWF